MPDEKKFPFDFMKAVQDVTNDTAEVRVDVINSGDIGGGTQYPNGDAQATPTGNVALGFDGSNVRALKTDSGGELQVDVLSVTGNVAVTNAGLTELASAINASSQMDVNIAASGATVPVSNAGLTSLNGAISGTEVQVDVLTIAAGNNNIGDVDVASIAAGDNNIGNVDIVSGTITTVSTVTTLTGGGVAHDSADSGNPNKIGFKAFSPDGTTPGAVAENDRTDGKADLNGRQYVNTRSPQSLHKHLDGTAAYTDESVIADPGDGFQAVITGITFSSGEAVAINFFLEEGSTKIFGPIYIEAVAGRGFTAQGMYLPCTASTAVTLTTSAANDQSFDLDYFIQAV